MSKEDAIARGDVIDDAALAAEEQRLADEKAAAEAKVAEDAEEEARVAALKKDGEKTDEEKEAAEKAAADAEAKKGITVPKARLDEANRKAREAIAERDKKIQELTARKEQESQAVEVQKLNTQLIKLEEAYAAARADGKTEDEVKIMRQIRAVEKDIISAETSRQNQATHQQTVEAVRYDLAVEKMEQEHAVLRPNDPDYDQEVVNDVLRLMNRNAKAGDAPAEALTSAVNDVMQRRELDELRAKAKELSDEAERLRKEADAEKDPAKKAAKEAAAKAAGLAAGKPDRKAAAVAKNLATNKDQPNNASKAGTDSHKLGGDVNQDPEKMTDADFSALPASTLARMRGDFV